MLKIKKMLSIFLLFVPMDCATCAESPEYSSSSNDSVIQIELVEALEVQPSEKAVAPEVSAQDLIVETSDILNSRWGELSRNIQDFRNKYPQFDYGIKAMDGLYDRPDRENMYSEINPCTGTRTLIFAGSVITSAACEITKCLSIFHSSVPAYGTALVALYATKALLWGVDSLISNKSRQSSFDMINIFHVEPKGNMYLSDISAQIGSAKIDAAVKIANDIIKFSNGAVLEPDDKRKLKRLELLTSEIDGFGTFKKVLVGGGKILNFATGIATGIVVALTGQGSPPAYWLTLIAGGADSIIDSASLTLLEKPILEKYISISEILYLCQHLLTVVKPQFIRVGGRKGS